MRDESSDTGEDDFDLFSSDSDNEGPTFNISNDIRNVARIHALAALPPLDQRSSAQARSAYVLNQQLLQPTVLRRVFSAVDCATVIDAVVEYSRTRGRLHTDRHERFPTTDVAVAELTMKARALIDDLVSTRILSTMATATGFDKAHLGLKDLFVVCYASQRPMSGDVVHQALIESSQNSLPLHRDGCLLSFSLLLNKPSAFSGGGTYFKHVDETVLLEQGDALIHDSRLEHAGMEVTAGQRIVLVGFIDTICVLKEKDSWGKHNFARRAAG